MSKSTFGLILKIEEKKKKRVDFKKKKKHLFQVKLLECVSKCFDLRDKERDKEEERTYIFLPTTPPAKTSDNTGEIA